MGLACSLPGRNAALTTNGAVGILSRQLDLVEKGIDPASLVQVGDPLQLLAGELVRVSNGGEALLDYGDQLQVRLFNDTSTNLVEAASVPGTPLSVQLYLELGGMTGRLKSPGGSLQVRTPGGAQVLVLGTRFFVIYDSASRLTWVGNFEGLMGVAAAGENAQLPSGYYLMVPAGERPGPPLPLPFDQVQLEARARQLGSASAALARLALVGLPSTPRASLLTEVPRGTVAVITPRVTEILPVATQAPAPVRETPPPARDTQQRLPVPTDTPFSRTPDTVAPYITVLDPSSEPVGVGRTCPPGAGVVRLKSVVFDPSGVASVTASWSLVSLPGAPPERGVEELRHNDKGNYIGEIGPFDSPGRLQVVLEAVDGAGNRGSAPPFSVDLSTCPDRSTPVIGTLRIDPQVMPGQVCAGAPTRLEFIAPVRDDGQLDRVIAIWEVVGQKYTAEMEPAGEDLYRTELVVESPAGQVPLRIEAYDSAGNRAGSTSLPLLVEDCRDEIPEIRKLGLSARQIAAGGVCQGLPSTVILTAEVVDDRAVERVTARWSLGGASGDAQLEQVEPDFYQVELGPFGEQGILNIEVSASDSSGQNADPRRDEVAVTGCPDSDGPEIEILSVEPREVYIPSHCTPQTVTVTARVTDNSQVRQVLAAWQLGDADGVVELVEVDQGVYRAELGPFPLLGEASLTLSAWDSLGNEGSLPAGQVVVYGCRG